MQKMKTFGLLALGAALALPAFGQEAAPGRRTRPGGEGAREGRERPAWAGREGGPNLEEMRQQWQARRNQQIREQLQATDEEWTVIEPLINRVNAVRQQGAMQAMARRARARTAEGGDAAPWGGDEQGVDEATALRQLLADAGATPETIAERLTALREARAKQAEELKKAREELRAVLTLRQEAQLVLNGTLD